MSDHPKQDFEMEAEPVQATEPSAGLESNHEKGKFDHSASTANSSVESGLAEDEITLDPAKERALVRRLDMVFIPVVTLTYISCFLDRSNIGGLAAIYAWEETALPLN